jgi:tetratricopeptide (TPR) repeat protein
MWRGWVLVVAHAVLAVGLSTAHWGEDAACDGARTMSGWRAPADAAAQARAHEARTAIARARIESVLGHYALAVTLAQQAVDTAVALDDRGLEAAALVVRGQNEERAGSRREAEASLRRAVELAAATAEHRIRAEALVQLVYVVGDTEDAARQAEAFALAAEAAAVVRVTEPDGLLRAQLDHNVAVVAKRKGDLDLALAHSERARAGYERIHGADHPSTLRALLNYGNLLRARKRFAEAESCLRRAGDGLERRLGADHPLFASALSNLAITLARAGRPADAVPVFARVLAIRERHDANHPDVAKAHYNLARALFDSAAYADALVHYERGLDLRRSAGATEAQLAEYREAIAETKALVRRG